MTENRGVISVEAAAVRSVRLSSALPHKEYLRVDKRTLVGELRRRELERFKAWFRRQRCLCWGVRYEMEADYSVEGSCEASQRLVIQPVSLQTVLTGVLRAFCPNYDHTSNEFTAAVQTLCEHPHPRTDRGSECLRPSTAQRRTDSCD